MTAEEQERDWSHDEKVAQKVKDFFFCKYTSDGLRSLTAERGSTNSLGCAALWRATLCCVMPCWMDGCRDGLA